MLVGNIFQAADEAGATLRTIVVFQADLLKDLSMGRGISEEAFSELHQATDLSL